MAKDGPYLGGEKRLITFDSTKMSIMKKSNVYYKYTKNNQGTMKYGIYKDNPSIGLNSNALVNSTEIDDFDWYDSVEIAQSHGVVTAYLWDNRDYVGNNQTANIEFYLDPIWNEEKQCAKSNTSTGMFTS